MRKLMLGLMLTVISLALTACTSGGCSGCG